MQKDTATAWYYPLTPVKAIVRYDEQDRTAIRLVITLSAFLLLLLIPIVYYFDYYHFKRLSGLVSSGCILRRAIDSNTLYRETKDNRAVSLSQNYYI